MAEPTRVLAVDVGSGGVAAALVDARLEVLRRTERSWDLAALAPSGLLEAAFAALRECATNETFDAVALSSMMHTLLVTDESGTPTGPLFTWQSDATPVQQAGIRARVGDDYHRRTGAHAHPSFPAFRLAQLADEESPQLEGRFRIASARSFLQAALTDARDEDISTASATGLLDVSAGEWDPVTLAALGLSPGNLPRIVQTTDIVGNLTRKASGALGVRGGIPVVAGGADGPLANLGSGCDDLETLAVTLGTTGAVRRFVSAPVLEAARGTFCYRYSADRFLLGCATSNGGDVLDWARRTLGGAESAPRSQVAPPLFLPFLHGERSPFWDCGRRARWVGIHAGHGPGDLWRSALEAVAFVLGIYCDRVGPPNPVRVVLSGNGFRTPDLAATLAALVGSGVVLGAHPGDATLRGAARCGLEALGIDTGNAARELAEVDVQPIEDTGLLERFGAFKEQYFS